LSDPEISSKLLLDKTGCSEDNDQREVKVIVPIPDLHPSVPVPMDRHSKRSTFTACIAAHGSRMKPFVILSCAPAEEELRSFGDRSSNIFLASQENAFMSKVLFELWAREVFFPTVQARRADCGYNGRALLIKDSLESHHTEWFQWQCGEQDIDIIFLVPHSSGQTEPLELITPTITSRPS
jgi:hypothetical protein